MSDGTSFSAVALFAEDAREEVAGTISLIGIMPDAIAVASFPAILPRLQVYIRISYDPRDPPETVACGLRVNDEAAILAQTFEPEALRRTIADTVRSGGQIGSIVGRFGAVNVQLNEPCRLNATITWNDAEYIIGTLTLKAFG